jgi:hypothetical protein
MKHYTVTIKAMEDTPEGDLSLFGYEEHQLILSEEEELLGVCMVYKGSDPVKIDQDS